MTRPILTIVGMYLLVGWLAVFHVAAYAQEAPDSNASAQEETGQEETAGAPEDAKEQETAKPARPKFTVPPDIDFSIFLKYEDVEKIHRALDIYERSLQLAQNSAPEPVSKEEEDFLSKLAAGLENTQAPGEKKPEEANEIQRPFSFPTFYLDSFILRSKNDWVVWIDGKKYTPEMPKRGDIEISSVTKNGVLLVWHPSNMERVETLNRPGLYDQTGINIDTRRKVVEFMLNINQTIYTDQMKIMEGRMAPTPEPQKDAAVEGNDSAPKPIATPPEAAAPAVEPVASTATPAAEAEKKPVSGLEGIRQIYDNKIPLNMNQ